MSINDSWKNQARNGRGEFGESLRDEVDIDPASLHPATDPRHARLAAIVDDKYVPATAEPGSAIEGAHANGWWDKHSVLSEHRPAGRTGYPRIPETGPTGRRIVRRQYQGAGLHLQMPSAAAIRRFSTNSGGAFDVPVSAKIGGRTADAWVRVTATGPGQYKVSTLGIPGENGDKVSEAVNAVLEARRVTHALPQIEDLTENAKQRLEQRRTGAEQKEIQSWITTAGYDTATGVSSIVIKGKAYGYRIPKELHDEVYTSTAPGTLFNMMIKPTGDDTGVQVTQCSHCSMVHVVGQPHQCEGSTRPTIRVGEQGRSFRRRAALVLKTRLGLQGRARTA